MKIFPYLFRMYSHEYELLNSLSTCFPDKRQTLSAALYALNREVAEREADNAANRDAILARLRALEEQVAELTMAPGKPRRGSMGLR